jgi:hygromycin-B 4-O-kinase
MRITTQTVEEIIIHHLHKAPSEITQIHGGKANFVFDVKLNKDEFIVRISDNPSKLKSYLKEQWAVTKVREKNVPAPEILEVGNDAVPFPYMIVRKAQGLAAELHPKRPRIVREMAEYMKIIHSIPTTGYGEVFEWSSNQLSRNATWKEFLTKEINVPNRLEIIEKTAMMQPRELKLLKRTLKEMEKWEDTPVLNHGDMRLKNVLVTKEGVISCILDWEMSCSHIPPYWDMSIALHDLALDERQIFIEGYGSTLPEYIKMANYIRAINIVNYAHFIEKAYIANDEKELNNFRARLHGALDLFMFDEEELKRGKTWLPFGLGDFTD